MSEATTELGEATTELGEATTELGEASHRRLRALGSRHRRGWAATQAA